MAPVSQESEPPAKPVRFIGRGGRGPILAHGQIFPTARLTPMVVSIAGPGVSVYSSAPDPAATPQPPFFRLWWAQYDTISGTSMATPHVAGVAAYLKQENQDLTAAELWRLLTSRARSLSQPADDVGAGFLQA